MKKTIQIIVLLFLVQANLYAQTTKRVLILGTNQCFGDSFNYFLQTLAVQNGDSIYLKNYSSNNYWLSNHFNISVLTEIQNVNWDYVVLQENSQSAALPDSAFSSNTLDASFKLAQQIFLQKNCKQILFFEPWAWKYGDTINCPNNYQLCTYLGMQNKLSKQYKLLSDTLHAVVIPTSIIWQKVLSEPNGIDLYKQNSVQASLEGNYVTAAMLYPFIFEKPIPLNKQIFTFTTLVSNYLNTFSNTLMYDSLNYWKKPIGIYYPKISFKEVDIFLPYRKFNTSVSGVNEFHYTDSRLNWMVYHATQLLDTMVSLQINPTFAFYQGGNYVFKVSLSTNTGCTFKLDSVQKYIFPKFNGLDESNLLKYKVFPNPAAQKIFISGLGSNHQKYFTIYNTIGLKIMEGNLLNNEIDINHLKTGCYLLQITEGEKTVTKYFIKQ